VEQVAQLAQQNTLPEPTLDISLLSYSAPTVPPPTLSYSQQPAASSSSSSGHGSTGGTAALRNSIAAVPPPPPDDPWMTGRFGGAGTGAYPGATGAGGAGAGVNGGAPSSIAGTGLPSGWWKRQEKVSVQFGGQHGFVLNRYMVYDIATEVRKKTYTFAFVFLPPPLACYHL
jgi:sorting nexin-8